MVSVWAEKKKQKPGVAYHESVPAGSLPNPELSDVRHLLGQHSVDGHVQVRHVDLGAADVQLHTVVLHEQRDVLPVTIGQDGVFDGHQLLVGGGGEHHVQGVRLAVGNDLKNGPGAVGLLQGQQGAPGFLELLEADQEDEAPLGLDGVQQVPEGALGDWGDQVRVHDLVGGSAGVQAADQTHSVLPLADPGEVK